MRIHYMPSYKFLEISLIKNCLSLRIVYFKESFTSYSRLTWLTLTFSFAKICKLYSRINYLLLFSVQQTGIWSTVFSVVWMAIAGKAIAWTGNNNAGNFGAQVILNVVCSINFNTFSMHSLHRFNILKTLIVR